MPDHAPRTTSPGVATCCAAWRGTAPRPPGTGRRRAPRSRGRGRSTRSASGVVGVDGRGGVEDERRRPRRRLSLGAQHPPLAGDGQPELVVDGAISTVCRAADGCCRPARTRPASSGAARTTGPQHRRPRRCRPTSASRRARRRSPRRGSSSAGEELERRLGLRLLLAAEVDAPSARGRTRDLDGGGRPSPGAHLVDSSRMREPSGYSHISATTRRRTSWAVNFSLSTKIGPRTAQVVELDPLGSVGGEEGPLLLGEQLAQRDACRAPRPRHVGGRGVP